MKINTIEQPQSSVDYVEEISNRSRKLIFKVLFAKNSRRTLWVV